MAKRQDLRQDSTGDLYINTTTGDFEIVESDSQHVGDIMQSINGDYKLSPLVGVNFFLYQNSTGKRQEIERIIRTQLKADGYNVTGIEVPENVTDVQDITIFSDEPNI